MPLFCPSKKSLYTLLAFEVQKQKAEDFTPQPFE